MIMKHSMRLERFQRGKMQDAQGVIAVQNATLPAAYFFSNNRVTMRRMVSWLLIALSTIVVMQWATAERALAQGFHIYVPMVATEGSGPGGSGSTPEECGLNSEEMAVAKMMEEDPGQRRSEPVCDPILAQVARGRARDMALRGYFSHTNPDGIGPNYLARQAGYPLPDWYSDNLNSNNIESIGGGYTSAGAVWQGWLDSSAHRTHVLGTQDFYAEQRAYGVGYYYNADAPLKHYWVFLSAPLPSGE
jgi:uncharacterized protein YkwD